VTGYVHAGDAPHPPKRVAGTANPVATGGLSTGGTRLAALLVVALAALVSLSPGKALATDDEVAGSNPRGHAALFYFFSPDWRPPDLGKLAVAVEDSLAAGGLNVSFQAFTRYEDFERQVREKPPVFMIAPAWLDGVAGHRLGVGLTVVARPVRHGKSTYRKALMTRPGIDSIDDLARGSIAATLHSTSEGSPTAVLDVFHLAPDSAKVVPVPKDVDALLALSFGQVDAALVTSEQYELLAQTRPADAERLRVLAFSPEVKLPPVFACSPADPQLRDRLRDLLLGLAEVPQGAVVLRLLGFDRFVADTPAGAGADASSPMHAGVAQTPQPQASPPPADSSAAAQAAAAAQRIHAPPPPVAAVPPMSPQGAAVLQAPRAPRER